MAPRVAEAILAPPLPRLRLRPGRLAGRVGQYALLALASVVVLGPLYLAVVNSLLPTEQIFAYPPKLYVTDPEWGTYRQAFDQGSLGRYLINSAIVTTLITAGQLVTAILAAYAFSHLRFPFRNAIFVVFLATAMVPWEVTIIPNYQTIAWLDWLDSYQGLTVPFLATAFGTFLLRQAFLTVPRELWEAAQIDGCGHLRYLARILVPVSRPAIAALAVFAFLSAWNQYLWPLLVTNESSHRTVQIGLKSLVSENMDQFNVVMAGTVIAIIPMLVLLVIFQRYLIRSLTAGALKG